MTPPRRLGLRVPHQGWNIHRPCFGESQTLCLKAAEEYARNRVVERPLVFVRRVLTVSDADRLKSARLDDSFDIRAKRFVTALPVDHHERRATIPPPPTAPLFPYTTLVRDLELERPEPR